MEIFKTLKQDSFIDFISAKKYVWPFSIICCFIAIISLLINGLNFSLEFTGGIQLEVSFTTPVSIDYIKNNLESIGFKSSRVQHYGSTKDFLIRLPAINQDHNQVSNKIMQTLNSDQNKLQVHKVEYIGSEVGDKLLEHGAIAVVISIFATMLYIAIRFEHRLAVSAAITLFHNALIVLGFFSIFRHEFDLATLAAILAVIGYSLNDTIVIFDRVRENFRKDHKHNVKEIVNIAVNQTLSRTIMTSFLTLLVVISLLLVGGKSLFGFALALTIGIFIGTYASIYISSSIALWMGLNRKDFLTKR